MNQLRLTPGATADGLVTFRLGLWRDAKELQSWAVNSGARGAQVLRTYEDPQSRPGNLEPIPEEIYGLGQVEWSAGSGNWSASWGAGLGPVWISILDPGGSRGEFGFHLDANREQSPGSAGCIVFANRAGLESFLAAFSQHKPQRLVVDYGRGTVPGAPKVGDPAPKPERTPMANGVRVWCNDRGLVLDVTANLPAGRYQLYSDGTWNGKLVAK